MREPSNRKVWIEQARARLRSTDRSPAGWGYRCDTKVAVEPTVLASLGLLATLDDELDRRIAVESANRIASSQRFDGSIGVDDDSTSPEWATPFAVLLWTAVRSHSREAELALDRILYRRGDPFDQGNDHVVGHNTKLVGWPWVEKTHSWVEPTAHALIALAARRRIDHPHAQEGVRLLLDRALPSGGWNYGNTTVYGRPLRPQPEPTGLALSALSLCGASANSAVVAGIAYLQQTLKDIRTPRSLGWGLIGLTACGARPQNADEMLIQAYNYIADQPTSAIDLGLLLLAAGEPIERLVGTVERKGDDRL